MYIIPDILNYILIEYQLGVSLNRLCEQLSIETSAWFVYGGFLRMLTEQYGSAPVRLTTDQTIDLINQYQGDIDIMVVTGNADMEVAFSILQREIPSAKIVKSKYDFASKKFTIKNINAEFRGMKLDISFTQAFAPYYDFTVNTLAYQNPKLRYECKNVFTTLFFGDIAMDVTQIYEDIARRKLIVLYGLEIAPRQEYRLKKMVEKGYSVELQEPNPKNLAATFSQLYAFATAYCI